MRDPLVAVTTVFLSEFRLYFFHFFQMYSSPSIISARQLAGCANKQPSKERAQWPALDKKSDCANGQRRR